MRGSCLCQAVTFEVNGPVQSLQACHCTRCRKFYGSAFGPIAIVAAIDFAYTAGEDSIESFASSERVNRYFCRTCGSPLPIREDWDPLVGIPLGLLDDDPGQEISSHIFVGSKAPWYEITEDVPTHAEWPPNEDMEERFRTLKR